MRYKIIEMKLIGQNSASKYVSYFFAIIFSILLLFGIYELIGWIISYYNLKSGNSILRNLFITGTDVGWSKNQWTSKMDSLQKFKFYFPFTEANFRTGFFDLSTFIGNTFGNLFMVVFTYFSFRIFREFSKQNFFNSNSVKLLQRFSWICILFFGINILLDIFVIRHFGAYSYSGLWFLMLGIPLLFVVEFFKKGHELQSENDLTI